MIDRLEQALARIIDGGIGAVFRLSVQPADIGRRLEHALLGARRTSTGHVVSANQYVVTLHPEDYVAFASWDDALSRELERWLAEVAFRHGVTMLAPVHVLIEADSTVSRREVRVTAGFSAAPEAQSSMPGPVSRLIPLSHKGDVIVLTGREVTVGRSPGNDLVFGAAEVSREHARLRRDGLGLEVQDLGSRNGTWVNGLRVTSHQARSGDEIAFGTLRFRLDLS